MLTPTLVRASHDLFEDHEHIACTSKTEQHLHELENDCDDLHLQLKVTYFDFGNNYELFSEDIHIEKALRSPKQFNSNFTSHKSSRAPPSYIIIT
ncbi:MULTISPECIES: hypothetical protein [unclassified Tenacibaculum]|uniref:hypothetical protein n=1 Tax=unclassified Tenacibaculum TaxID=2635139 RepID=UPI001F404BC6|nr:MULTISPECIES: hypothetical protein [unclassified Tenacibaculum]MCF2875604.1 hypothetical protein [Tenacibaculum sp. Cn5-1]MCF2935680.1 hypothetical protein [Tenacibaculum sp. Cn5-34]MCG7512240.1 hypothetical protein [Tenacibaculum sp. Cn5-46]